MGIWRTLTFVALGAIAVAAVAAGAAYAADYGLEAEVVSKQCSLLGASSITVETKVLGLRHTAGGMGHQVCTVVQSGNHIVYHVRSGRTSLYESEGGACLYDTVGGPGGCP